MEAKNSLFISAVKAGLIIGAVSIVVFLIEYVAGITPVGFVKPFIIMLVGLAITITVLVVFLKQYKASLGGFISFRDAFLYCLIAMVTSTILSAIFTLLFIQFFDPEYIKNIMEKQKDFMENYLSGKMSDEQIAATLDKIDQKAASTTPMKQFSQSLISGVIFGGIIAAIVGAIMKKKPEMFDNTPESTI